MTMTQQIGNLSRETETMKKNQMKVLELKNVIINMKNLLVMFNSRFETKREIYSEMKDKSIEIMSV